MVSSGGRAPEPPRSAADAATARPVYCDMGGGIDYVVDQVAEFYGDLARGDGGRDAAAR